MEERVFQIERIGQAVRRVNAHDERPFAMLGQMHAGGGGGYAGFTDAAFAAEQESPHKV